MAEKRQYKFENFKKLKGRIISHITSEKKEYYELSEKFRYCSETVRTELVHNGRRLEDIIPDIHERNKLFVFFHQSIFTIINNFIHNYDMSWTDSESIVKIKQENILKS